MSSALQQRFTQSKNRMELGYDKEITPSTSIVTRIDETPEEDEEDSTEL